MIDQPRIIDAHFTANGDIIDSPLTTIEAGAEYEVLEVIESHAVLGTDGGAVTLDVKKCTGTQTPAQGTSVLLTTFNLKATINTPVTKSRSNVGLAASIPTRRLKGGDRLCADITGVTTAVAGLALTIVLRRLRKGTIQ